MTSVQNYSDQVTRTIATRVIISIQVTCNFHRLSVDSMYQHPKSWTNGPGPHPPLSNPEDRGYNR